MSQPTGGQPPAPGAPATPPATDPPAQPPAQPPAFDPATAPPEVKAWLESERKRIAADEETKARVTSKANAAKEEQERIFKAFQAAGLLPGGAIPSDPATVAAQLAAVQEEATALKRTQAVERAAWSANADPERVAAMLNYQGKLGSLDPAAPDFAAAVKTLVEESVAANPWMKREGAPATPPPAAGGTAGVGSAPPPPNGQRGQGGMAAAIRSAMGGNKPT